MIKAEEFRIGNWVYDFARKPVQIIRLTKGAFPLEMPIPLTHKILVQFGFTCYLNPNNTGSVIYDLNDFKIIEHKTEDFSLRDMHSKRFTYLHQLQNLYFALTGEELEIKLNVETHR